MKIDTNIKNQKFYLLIGGNLLVLALIGGFVLRPLFGMLSKHTSDITRTRSEITALQKKTNDLRALKQTYPIYEATYAPLVQNAPKTKDIAAYQAELDELAAMTHVTLTVVDTSGKGDSAGGDQAVVKDLNVGGFPAFPVKANLIGSYTAVLDFTNRVETMDRFTRVAAMKLERLDAAGNVKATLDLQTLYFGK